MSGGCPGNRPQPEGMVPSLAWAGDDDAVRLHGGPRIRWSLDRNFLIDLLLWLNKALRQAMTSMIQDEIQSQRPIVDSEGFKLRVTDTVFNSKSARADAL